jgi:hypothetical protein
VGCATNADGLRFRVYQMFHPGPSQSTHLGTGVVDTCDLPAQIWEVQVIEKQQKSIEQQFEEHLRQDCDIATRKGYNPIAFRQMIKTHHGVTACILVIMTDDFPPPPGFIRLYDLSALELSAEASVLKWPWCQLFEKQVLRKAQDRLKKYNRADLTECRCLA